MFLKHFHKIFGKKFKWASYSTHVMLHAADKSKEQKRRKLAALNIAFVCIGVVLLTSAASAEYLPKWVMFWNQCYLILVNALSTSSHFLSGITWSFNTGSHAWCSYVGPSSDDLYCWFDWRILPIQCEAFYVECGLFLYLFTDVCRLWVEGFLSWGCVLCLVFFMMAN